MCHIKLFSGVVVSLVFLFIVYTLTQVFAETSKFLHFNTLLKFSSTFAVKFGKAKLMWCKLVFA